ncbi:hypothetical protein HDU85_006247 [Gaertneriomyces sp. JEL0708]|nr:hypothetical protein HDU85_006247 [Gaertneriomyces sp. JEL0708]
MPHGYSAVPVEDVPLSRDQGHQDGDEGASSPTGAAKTVGLNRQLLLRLRRIIRVLAQSGTDSLAWAILTLIALSAAFQVIVYCIGVTLPRFYVVLGKKDVAGFWRLVSICLSLFVVISFITASVHLVGGILSLRTQRRLSRYLHDAYVRAPAFYRIATNEQTYVDNPDQRITQDVANFSTELRKMIEKLAIEPVLIVYYTWQTLKVNGWAGPVIIYGFYFASLFVTRAILQPIARLVYRKERAEGDFRFLHVRLRSHAESVAFLDGEGAERHVVDDALDTLIRLKRKIIDWESGLKFFTRFVDYCGSMMCYGTVAIPIFGGVYDDLPPEELSALIAKNLFFTLFLTYRFRAIVKTVSRLGDVAGYTARIGHLLESIDDINADAAQHIAIHTSHKPGLHDRSYINIENVTLYHPQGHVLMVDLNLQLTQGMHLLIMGRSGCGKSSLLRAIKGLSAPGKGSIDISPDASTLFLPQKSYLMQVNSLSRQITYPDEKDLAPEELYRVLKAVRLDHLLERQFDLVNDTDWHSVLSPGEQQRLVFARLLWRRPTFAFLDESTCSVDRQTEEMIFRAAMELGITFLCVSHRVIPGFQKRLTFHNNVGWSLDDAPSVP